MQVSFLGKTSTSNDASCKQKIPKNGNVSKKQVSQNIVFVSIT